MIHVITYVATESHINNCEHEQLLPEAKGIDDNNLISGVIKRSCSRNDEQEANVVETVVVAYTV